MEISEKIPNLAIKTVPYQYAFTPQEMYKIPRFVKDFWAMPSYKTPKYYPESHNTLFQPKFEKSGISFEKPIIPQPSHTYLNEIIMGRRNSPSPNEYQRMKLWFTPPKKLQELKKIPHKIVENSEKKSPGVGDYNLLESDENIRKKLEKLKKREEAIKKIPSEKIHLLNDEIFLAGQSPGPGAYFTKTAVTFPKKKSRKSLSPDQRTQKNKQTKIKQDFIKSKSPDNREYSPLPLNFFTFDRFQKEESFSTLKKKNDRPQFLFIGGDRRFRYPEQKKGFEPGPGPDVYNIDLKWPKKEKITKNSPKNQKKIK